MTTTLTVLPTPVDYHCPEWCERTDHSTDLVDAERLRQHAASASRPAEWIEAHQGS